MITKIASLCAVFVAVNAGGLIGVALENTGVSSTSREQDAHGNYAFSYDIVDAHGASNSRSEAGDALGNKKGFYTLNDIDGRARRVDYVADSHGFRAVVNTNEPGTAQSAPADVIINSPYAGPEASAVVHVAPVPVAPVAPVAVGQVAPVAVGHVATAGFSTKSVVSHAAPFTPVSHTAPVALTHAAPIAPIGVAHTAPVAYSTKSIAVPVAVPSGYSSKSVISHDVPVSATHPAPIAVAHSAPLAYSTKSVISHATPVAHVAPLSVTAPFGHSSKSVISHSAPITSHYTAAPISLAKYGSIYNRGFGIGRIGYDHGLLGHQLGGLGYNSGILSHGLLGNGLRGLHYGSGYGHELLGSGLSGLHYGSGYGHGLLGHSLGGLTYGNGIYGYGGLKSY